MARIVCQVLHRADRVTIIWSQGGASFEPYHLEGPEWLRLMQTAEQLHVHLADGTVNDVARLGHVLWQALLRVGSPDPGPASAVQTWLAPLVRGNAIERLQFLTDRPGLIPWNLLCDDAPTSGELWARFWGTRFLLGGGRRVNALHANPAIVTQTRLCAADLRLVGQLDAGQREQTVWLREANQLVHTVASLEEDVKKRSPDVLLLLVPCADGNLWLGSDVLDLDELRSWIDAAAEGNPEPIVILMGSGDKQMEWTRHLQHASALFSGLIANETLLPATRSFPIGSVIARRLAEGKSNLGEILRAIRQEHDAAGLAFSAFCPLEVKASVGDAAAPAELQGESQALPDTPYRPFAAYDAAERALFVGRDADTSRAAAALDDAGVRVLILHGAPGAGKTSFLQAALIPHLEQENLGYLTLRDRSLQDAPASEREYPRLILRATDDLAGQFADALAVFCARPWTYTTPTGTPISVDLPGLLQKAIGGAASSAGSSTAIQDPAVSAGIAAGAAPSSEPAPSEGTSPRDLWIALRDERDRLGRVLDALTRALPFELLIVVDQAEELFTLVRGPQQSERRQKALAMLRSLSQTAPRCKIVLALRTQSVGQLAGHLPGGQMPADWHPFQLRPLSDAEMASALLWPTNRVAIPYAPDVPGDKYGFAYEDGLAERIVADAVAAASAARISPLPIVQAVGALLYENQVVDKKKNILRAEDIKAIGGVDDALANCLKKKVHRLQVAAASKKALQVLISKLTTTHADGTVSRDLVRAAALKPLWQNPTDPVEPVVNRAADEAGLFDIQQLLIGGQEDIYVSLAQDSLAHLGLRLENERQQQTNARNKVIDVLWIMIPLIFLAAAISFWATRTFGGAGAQAKKDDDDTRAQMEELVGTVKNSVRPPLYYGQLARVQQALDAENALRAQQVLMESPAMRSLQEAQGREKKGFGFRDLRGFEWYYLKKALHGERYLLAGHQGPVGGVAVSRDGERAATGSIDGDVRVWNLKTGEVLALLPGKKLPIHAVAFAPDGKTLAAAGEDKIVYLWDVSGLKTDYAILKDAKTLKDGHTGVIKALVYSKDGALASAGTDNRVVVWDVAAGKEKRVLKEHKKPVLALAYTPDGKSIVSAGEESDIVVSDPDSGTKRYAIATGYATVHALSIAPDGKTLCAGGIDVKLDAELGVLRFFDLDKQGKAMHTSIAHGAGVLAVAFGSDGKSVASGGKDHVVRLFDVATGKQTRRWLGHLGFVGALAFAPDGATLISGSHDQFAKAWNAAHSSGSEVIQAHADWVQCLALSPKGKLLASGARDGTVKLWDPATGADLKAKGMPTFKAAVTAVALSAHKDKNFLAVGTRGDKDEGDVRVYQIDHDEKSGYALKEIHAFTGHKRGITCLAFNPSADRADQLASGSADETVKLYDIAKKEEVHTYRDHKAEVRSIAFHSEGKLFASGGKDKRVCMYEPGKKDVWILTDTHLNSIEALVLLPVPTADPSERFEITRIMTGSADHAIRIWDVIRSPDGKIDDKDKAMRRHYRSHVQPVTSLAYSAKPDGLIVSAGADGAIKLHDIASESFTLLGHVGPVRAVLVGPEQAYIVSAGNDGTIRFWRAAERVAEKAEKK